jgi:hypothetical protein
MFVLRNHILTLISLRVVSEIRLVFLQSKMIQKITTRCIFLQKSAVTTAWRWHHVDSAVLCNQRIAASTNFLAMHHISNETVLNKCKYVFKYV